MRLGKHKILINPESRFEAIYKSTSIYERHRHRYEVNPEYIELLEKNGLVFSGKSEDGRRMETLEIDENPYFIATQYHPEFQSRPNNPSPPYLEFIKSALSRKK